MHVMFVHRSFPAQFGQVAEALGSRRGWRCTYVSKDAPSASGAIQHIRYQTSQAGGGRDYLTQDFAYETKHAAAVYHALKPMRYLVRPDLIVGHAGFGSTLFLQELYPDTPIIDYFEYFHHPHGSAIDFRPDHLPSEQSTLRHRLQNASILLHLEYCTAGYSPTHFQHGLLPEAYRDKVRVIPDGVDTAVWRRLAEPVPSKDGTRIVTYVARGLESMRGFDIFMRTAKLIYERYPRVVFLVVGSDTVVYGSDRERITESTFKDHVLAQDAYDLDRIHFLGHVSRDELVRVLSLSDLHIYLTVPFVLSWSLLNAMACGCTVLASDTAPVREVIRDRVNGLMCDFFDVEGLAETAIGVLKEPLAHRDLGRVAVRTIQERYSLEVTLRQLTAFFEEVAGGAPTPQEAATGSR